MSRLGETFARLKAEGQAGLIAYLMAGHPDGPTSLAMLEALADAGVDIIELGVPFSDPVADGPIIQSAGLSALEGGFSLAKTLEIAAKFREKRPKTPLILMGYLNPIEAMGASAFAKRAGAAGVDGALIVDLPQEESGEVRAVLADQGLALISLIAPTTGPQRLAAIAREAEGFIYCLSRAGITGAAAPQFEAAAHTIAQIRAQTALPVAVGFGVKTPADAARFAKIADAVVVGSAFVEIAARNGLGLDVVKEIATFAAGIVQAIAEARTKEDVNQ